MSNTGKIFETTNRKLEQFLYMHEILHIGSRTNEDTYTVWQYEDTPELHATIQEFKVIQEKRRIRLGKLTAENRGA